MPKDIDENDQFLFTKKLMKLMMWNYSFKDINNNFR